MTSGIPKPNIYPDYCHDLSPTIGKWCPLRAVDIHDLKSVGLFIDGKEIYHHGNHPIKWVRLTGVVVAVDEFYGRKVLTVDDSSGMCIECSCLSPMAALGLNSGSISNTLNPAPQVAKPEANVDKNGGSISAENPAPAVSSPKIPWDEVDVGVVVKIKGRVGSFRERKQVEVVKIDVLRSTDQEVRCWNEVLAFTMEVLRKPWVVEREQEEKCRRRAMRQTRWRGRGKDGDKKSRTRREAEESRRHKLKIGKEGREGITPSFGDLDNQMDKYEPKSLKHRAREVEGLESVNKVNYPSLTVRRKAAGKYDALGI